MRAEVLEALLAEKLSVGAPGFDNPVVVENNSIPLV
jgi:hypothetical protein